MMYWLRCAMLSVSVFFLVYVALLLVLALAWQGIRGRNLIKNADALFTLRILPLVGAMLVVLLVTIPSFWSLEPSAPEEGIGLPIALLFAAGSGWMLFRCAQLFRSWRKALRFFAVASASSRSTEIAAQIPAYELSSDAPNLFVSGVWRPTLFISRGAVAILDAREMQAAIQHELAHAQGRDNLKQIVVRFCAFPLLASLDREWLRAAEISADDRSVANELGAADLASALIKVGMASARFSVPELGMSLVPERDAPVSARVQRLLEWKADDRSHAGSHFSELYLLLLPVGAIALNLVWLMAQMHRFTELLFQ